MSTRSLGPLNNLTAGRRDVVLLVVAFDGVCSAEATLAAASLSECGDFDFRSCRVEKYDGKPSGANRIVPETLVLGLSEGSLDRVSRSRAARFWAHGPPRFLPGAPQHKGGAPTPWPLPPSYLHAAYTYGTICPPLQIRMYSLSSIPLPILPASPFSPAPPLPASSPSLSLHSPLPSSFFPRRGPFLISPTSDLVCRAHFRAESPVLPCWELVWPPSQSALCSPPGSAMTATMFSSIQADLLHTHRIQSVSSHAKVDSPCLCLSHGCRKRSKQNSGLSQSNVSITASFGQKSTFGWIFVVRDT